MSPSLTSRETDAIDDLRRELLREFKTVELRLFGSKARGQSNAESDLDVLVVLPQSNWQDERRVYELSFAVGLRHDVLLSPVVFTREELAASRTRVTPFYRLAIATAVPL
jgi:predicted nucleotidyltransferase